jgi:dGTPase
MYRHKKVVRMMSEARAVVRDLFGLYLSDPAVLPAPWRDHADAAGGDLTRRARIVCDYIAGMTDTYAIDEHLRLFNAKP